MSEKVEKFLFKSLGARCREFESPISDHIGVNQILLRCFYFLEKNIYWFFLIKSDLSFGLCTMNTWWASRCKRLFASFEFEQFCFPPIHQEPSCRLSRTIGFLDELKDWDSIPALVLFLGYVYDKDGIDFIWRYKMWKGYSENVPFLNSSYSLAYRERVDLWLGFFW